MNFIQKHWRGEYSLARSFWVNTILYNVFYSILFFAVYVILYKNLFVMMLIGFFIFIWQANGTWRSADRHTKETEKKFWPVVVKILIVLGYLNFFIQLGTLVTLLI